LDGDSDVSLSAQGVDMQNLVEIDLAVMNLRMREKCVGFF